MDIQTHDEFLCCIYEIAGKYKVPEDISDYQGEMDEFIKSQLSDPLAFLGANFNGKHGIMEKVVVEWSDDRNAFVLDPIVHFNDRKEKA